MMALQRPPRQMTLRSWPSLPAGRRDLKASLGELSRAAQNIEMADVFEKSEVKVWECRNCGHIIVGTAAPVICPTCNHPKSYFEVHAENY